MPTCSKPAQARNEDTCAVKKCVSTRGKVRCRGTCKREVRAPRIGRVDASLDRCGYESFGAVVRAARLEAVRDTLFATGEAGKRCLLDDVQVREIAIEARATLVEAGRLAPRAVAIQAIAFDKTADANWKVTWHQDVMFPFAEPVSAEGFSLPTVKDGVDYARPPVAVLEELLAVRIHLDECDTNNGPLRVLPGTHRRGIIPSAEIGSTVGAANAQVCLAAKGEALLLKPLTLHASSPAREPLHRRVLHLVYHSGSHIGARWHRAF